MTDNMWTKTQAKRLHAAGYRGVSNRHRIVARVDEDIVLYVQRDQRKGRHPGWSQYNFLLKMTKDERDDWFRRCVSKDTHQVSSEVYKAMKQL